MLDADLEVKLPQDLIDIIPQERVTGDILRGHGPRRGNLEALLRYWRPIMRKPGGFRRCIVILANHPELYPLQRICAWLHHETTGKWPNEGNHHGGGGSAGRVLRRAIPGKRRRRRRKKSDGGVEISSWRIYRRLGGMATRPINGDLNALEFKAARFKQGFKSVPMPGSFEWDEEHLDVKVGLVRTHGRSGRWLQSLASFFTPGDMGKYRSPLRSALWGSLTPGGGGIGGGMRGGGMGGGGLGGGLPSIAGAASALRCPTGYINGGRFTDPKLSNCGGMIFDQPAKGPGAVTDVDREEMTRRFESSQAQDLPDVVRDIVIKKPKGDPFAVMREAATKPKTRPNKKRRDSAVKDVLAYTSENKNETRLVRRDGAVFEPTVGPEKLARMDHDNIKEAVYVTSKIPEKGGIAGDEVRLLTRGLKAIEYSFPEGNVRLERTREIDAGTAAKIRTRWGGLTKHAALSYNPAEAMERLVKEFADTLSLKPSFLEMPGARDRIVVYSVTGERRIVPRWIFSLYLSLRAPRRARGTVKPFTQVPPVEGEGGPTKSEYYRPERGRYAVLDIQRKSLALRVEKSFLNVSRMRLAHKGGVEKESVVDIKAAKFLNVQNDPDLRIKLLGGLGRRRGRRLSNFARRMPEVVPYDPNPRDGDVDGLVQEGTIWERPKGTFFRGLKAGAKRLLVGAHLADADGNRVDYLPGEHPNSPIGRAYQFPNPQARAMWARRMGRTAQGAEGIIEGRDLARDAPADFTYEELAREKRRLRLQGVLERMRTQPERRARRAPLLEERAEESERLGEEARLRSEELREEIAARRELRQRRRDLDEEFNEEARQRWGDTGTAREEPFRVVQTNREVNDLNRRRREARARLTAEADPNEARRERASQRLDALVAKREKREAKAAQRTLLERILDRNERMKATADKVRRKFKEKSRDKHVEEERQETVEDLDIPLRDLDEQLSLFSIQEVFQDAAIESRDDDYVPLEEIDEDTQAWASALLEEENRLVGTSSVANDLFEQVQRGFESEVVDGARSDFTDELLFNFVLSDENEEVIPTAEMSSLVQVLPNLFEDEGTAKVEHRMLALSRERLSDKKLWINEVPEGILRAGSFRELLANIEENIEEVDDPAKLLVRLDQLWDSMVKAGDMYDALDEDSRKLINRRLKDWRDSREGVEDLDISGLSEEDALEALFKATLLRASIQSEKDRLYRVRSDIVATKSRMSDEVGLDSLADSTALPEIDSEDLGYINGRMRQAFARRFKRAKEMDEELETRSGEPERWGFEGYGINLEELFEKIADGTADAGVSGRTLSEAGISTEEENRLIEAIQDVFMAGRIFPTKDKDVTGLVASYNQKRSNKFPAGSRVGRLDASSVEDYNPPEVMITVYKSGGLEIDISGSIWVHGGGPRTMRDAEAVKGFGWVKGGEFDRTLFFRRDKSGRITGELYNGGLGVDDDRDAAGVRVNLQQRGIGGIFTTHTLKSTSALGVDKATLIGADDGEFIWGLYGYKSDDGVPELRMISALQEAVDSYRINGPDENNIILDDGMANEVEELLAVHARSDALRLLHAHQIFRGVNGKHPWEDEDGDEKLNLTTGGIRKRNKYKTWWLNTAPLDNAHLPLDGDFGELLEGERSGTNRNAAGVVRHQDPVIGDRPTGEMGDVVTTSLRGDDRQLAIISSDNKLLSVEANDNVPTAEDAAEILKDSQLGTGNSKMSDIPDALLGEALTLSSEPDGETMESLVREAENIGDFDEVERLEKEWEESHQAESAFRLEAAADAILGQQSGELPWLMETTPLTASVGTRVFYLLNPDGNPTIKGLVVKGADARMEVVRMADGDIPVDTVATEFMGMRLANAVGYPTGTPRLDSLYDIGEDTGPTELAPRLVYETAGNLLDDDEVTSGVTAAASGREIDLESELRHAVFRYLLGANDVHDNNILVTENGEVIPIDHQDSFGDVELQDDPPADLFTYLEDWRGSMGGTRGMYSRENGIFLLGLKEALDYGNISETDVREIISDMKDSMRMALVNEWDGIAADVDKMNQEAVKMGGSDRVESGRATAKMARAKVEERIEAIENDLDDFMYSLLGLDVVEELENLGPTSTYKLFKDFDYSPTTGGS